MVAANDAPTSSPRSKLAAKAARTAAKRAAHSPSTEDGDAMRILVCRRMARHNRYLDLAQSHFASRGAPPRTLLRAASLAPSRDTGGSRTRTALEEGSHGARDRPTGAAT